MSGRAISLYAIVRFCERGHKGASKLRLVGRGVDLSEVRVEGEVFDLPVGQIFSIERFQRHTIVTHSFLPMSTHLGVAFPRYLSILLV
jgi:hypothetical protein